MSLSKINHLVFLIGQAVLHLMVVALSAHIPLFISSTLLGITITHVLFLLSNPARWASGCRVPVLPDLGFTIASLVYYLHPALASSYTDYTPPPSLPLLQGIIGSLLCTFIALRLRGDWAAWAGIVSQAQRGFDGHLFMFSVALIGFFGLWVAIVSPAVVDYVTTEYGVRNPGQRSSWSIPLLGFDFLGISLAAFCSGLAIRAARFRSILLGVLPSFYGMLCFLIYNTRTSLLWGFVLSAGVFLLRFPIRRMFIIGIASSFFLLMPLFDMVGRVRYEIPTLDPERIVAAALDTLSLSYGEMVASNEAVLMTEHADSVLHFFAESPQYGKFILRAILQAPPAFVLRYFDYEEVQGLSIEYLKVIDPALYYSGGGYALLLGAEAYVNFRMLGGLVSGLLLFLFLSFFERAVTKITPGILAYPLLVSYSIAFSKLNRGGLEVMPKTLFVLLVFISICKGIEWLVSLLAFSQGRRFNPQSGPIRS